VNFAMFKVMALELWRDRAAMVMAFLLPPLVFVIFCVAFSGATGESVKLRVAVADVAHSPNSARLAHALLSDTRLRAELVIPASLEVVRARVHSGQVDSGIVLRADPAARGSPILILADPSREVAGMLTEARVRETISTKLSDVLLDRTIVDVSQATGPLTDDQKLNVSMAEQQLVEDPGAAAKAAPMFVRESVTAGRAGAGTIAYYAGAVTILFALFASMHGALTLIDERRSGIADRILAGRAGMGPVVTGKFLFLVAQVLVQAVAIFATAQVVYGVPTAQHLGLWLVTTLATGIGAGGLALGLVAVCTSRDQAQTLSTFVYLLLAAVGGSMIPRFLMPPWLQALGWFTPHAWVIDAYQGLLWRDAGLQDLYKAWIVLAAIGAGGLLVAQITARRVRI